MKTPKTPETLTAIAQQSFEGLLSGNSVPAADIHRLTETQSRFIIRQAGRVGTFCVDQVTVSLGAACPGVYVDVRADTERGPENFSLGLTADGRPNFEVHCLSEIPDAAGPV